MWKRLLYIVILVHASFGVWAASGSDDSYPSKVIRLVNAFPPGGSTDYMARLIGAKLTERFGQSVIVENRTGAGGNIAAEAVARAKPDGYTLLVGSLVPLTSSRSLYPKLGYDLLKDFSYISRLATSANLLLAHPSIPAKSVAELMALARSKPKAMHYGSGGVASLGQLAMELLQRRAGVELVHVPYKGAAPFLVALAVGEVDIGFIGVAASIPLLQAKRVKALAVSTAKRLRTLPDVPTVAESGFPGFDVPSGFGIFAPAGIPAAVVKLLNIEIRNILQMDDVRAKFAAQALEAVGSAPDEFRAIVEAETAQWARVIKDARITVD